MIRSSARGFAAAYASIALCLVGQWAAAGTKSAVEFFNRSQQDFVNSDCAGTNTCGLLSFSVIREDFRVRFRGPDPASLGTRMFAVYRTADTGDLEKFGVAQFIRGCVYSSQRRSDGTIVKRLEYVQPFHGKTVPFRHPTWVIDNLLDDPLSWGDDPRAARHAFYQWNNPPESLDLDTAKYWIEAKPPHPLVFVVDHPGTAFATLSDHWAKNISLQFRDCLYKSLDVPTSVPFDAIEFAVPIKCFDWSSSFVFNHATESYESPTDLDPFCRQSETASPPDAE